MHLDVIHYRKLLPPQQGFERRRRRPSLSSALYFTGKFERRLYWAPLPPQQGFHPCCGGANPYCGGAPWFRWRRNFSWQIETLKPSCRRHRRLSICQMMAMTAVGISSLLRWQKSLLRWRALVQMEEKLFYSVHNQAPSSYSILNIITSHDTVCTL